MGFLDFLKDFAKEEEKDDIFFENESEYYGLTEEEKEECRKTNRTPSEYKKAWRDADNDE